MDLGSDLPHSVMALLPTWRADISAMSSDEIAMGPQLHWQLMYVVHSRFTNLQAHTS